MKEIDDLSLAVEYSRLLREKFLNDPYRPSYHFVFPEDYGIPGDPNGAFYACGRYHLMYLYSCRSDGFRWGHVSSTDLVHWRSHPDILLPDEKDGGIFSGGAFVDDDGSCYITYWGLPVEGKGFGGIRIAKSDGPLYEKWEKFDNYVLECTESGVYETEDENGRPVYLCCADPSNIWKKDGKYYLQAGNLPILMKFGKDGLIRHTGNEIYPAAPDNIKGDWTDLFVSEDLKSWKYLHRFYERDQSNTRTAENEDDMCPSFLPLPVSKHGGDLSDKYLQLFISHNRGCQYYIGDYDRDKDIFVPLTHGRMTWIDNTFFAPEALLDKNNRQIMWSWLQDYNRFTDLKDEEGKGWSGVYGLPRALWLREDNSLGIAPIRELETLRYNRVYFPGSSFNEGISELNGINGLSCEIILTAEVHDGSVIEIYTRASSDFSEYTKITYDKSTSLLSVDASRSGFKGRLVLESAPLSLSEGEALELRIFIDKSMIEVFANDKQAITRRVYPSGSAGDKVYINSGSCAIGDITVYEMSPSNFC